MFGPLAYGLSSTKTVISISLQRERQRTILGRYVEALERQTRHGMLTPRKPEWEELLGLEQLARTIS